MVKAAVILAGGLGTRLRSVVQDVPKPMAPIHGRPFLAYQLDYWIAQGIERFVLSVGYKYECIVDFFTDKYKSASIDYVVEQTPIGTGGGFLLALKQMDSNPFLLLNGDTYFKVDLKQLSRFSIEARADWTFSLFETRDPARYMGLDISADGRIRSLKSTLCYQNSRLASGGVYWVNPASLSSFVGNDAGVTLSLEDDIFPRLLTSGRRMYGFKCSETFIDIGVPEDYSRSTSIFA